MPDSGTIVPGLCSCAITHPFCDKVKFVLELESTPPITVPRCSRVLARVLRVV